MEFLIQKTTFIHGHIFNNLKIRLPKSACTECECNGKQITIHNMVALLFGVPRLEDTFAFHAN
jgi:hypothetical protein